MSLPKSLLQGLVLATAAIVASSANVRAQGNPPTYKHIVIVDAHYSPNGSTYDLDLDGDFKKDIVVSDPTNTFFWYMMEEYTWQNVMTHIWVDKTGRIVQLEQSVF